MARRRLLRMSNSAPSSIRPMLDRELVAARKAFDRNDVGWEHLELQQ